MMTFILGYMWWKYVEYLGELLHQTKYILGIFEIDTILLNPYMVAFLERLRKKWVKLNIYGTPFVVHLSIV